MRESTKSRLILAGDIGGTNTNLALVQYSLGAFTIIHSLRFSTKKEVSLIQPITRLLASARENGIDANPELCCISGAGPVQGDRIQLTNASLVISATEVEKYLGIPVRLINDFSAISYAVALLDPLDSRQITRLPHCDGTQPDLPKEGLALVVGAGTGLGVGFLHKRGDGSCLAFPSEGGHSELPCWDELSYAYHRWLMSKLGTEPGIELAASGQGIASIFSFLCDTSFQPSMALHYRLDNLPEPRPTTAEAAILALPDQDKPSGIAEAMDTLPRCRLAMEVFARYYAAKVSSLATIFMPTAGIYLAGGISSRHEAFLMEDYRFMRIFERNYSAHMRNFLTTLPVMIVRDYSISLIGAANAAVQLAV